MASPDALAMAAADLGAAFKRAKRRLLPEDLYILEPLAGVLQSLGHKMQPPCDVPAQESIKRARTDVQHVIGLLRAVASSPSTPPARPRAASPSTASTPAKRPRIISLAASLGENDPGDLKRVTFADAPQVLQYTVCDSARLLPCRSATHSSRSSSSFHSSCPSRSRARRSRDQQVKRRLWHNWAHSASGNGLSAGPVSHAGSVSSAGDFGVRAASADDGRPVVGTCEQQHRDFIERAVTEADIQTCKLGDILRMLTETFGPLSLAMEHQSCAHVKLVVDSLLVPRVPTVGPEKPTPLAVDSQKPRTKHACPTCGHKTAKLECSRCGTSLAPVPEAPEHTQPAHPVPTDLPAAIRSAILTEVHLAGEDGIDVSGLMEVLAEDFSMNLMDVLRWEAQITDFISDAQLQLHDEFLRDVYDDM